MTMNIARCSYQAFAKIHHFPACFRQCHNVYVTIYRQSSSSGDDQQEKKHPLFSYNRDTFRVFGPKLENQQPRYTQNVDAKVNAATVNKQGVETNKPKSKSISDDFNQTKEVNDITESTQESPVNKFEAVKDTEQVTIENSNKFTRKISSNIQLNPLLLFPMFNPHTSNLQSSIKPDLLQLDLVKDLCTSRGWKPLGVTRILNATRPPEAQYLLDQWKKRMTEELGPAGFAKFQADMLKQGKNLHACIEDFLRGTPESRLDLQDNNKGYWDSINLALKDVDDVIVLEDYLTHPLLGYSGVIDCAAVFRNEVCIIDWKTSRKPKRKLEWTYDNPLQLAAYVGAMNFSDKLDKQIDRAVLVISYEDGSKADVHVMDRTTCIRYWGQWLQRLHLYYNNKLKKEESG